MPLELPLEKFYQWEKETPYKTFLKQPYHGHLKSLMWSDVSRQVRSIASFLMLQDFPSGSNIAIYSKNSAYWIMADLAIWLSGHISVPLFPNLDGPTTKSLLEHSETQLIFLEKGKNWESLKDHLPKKIPKVFLPPHKEKMDLLWEKICTEYEPFTQNVLRKGDEVATIIYTSGTTGSPKGVMHTFSSFATGAQNILDIVELKGEQHFFSYLPLAHVAERVLIEVGSLYVNATITFLENKNTFAKDIKKARPTVFLAVPYIWESIQKKILQKISQNKLNILLNIPFLKSYIKRKIRKRIGLKRTQFFLSGAASIKEDLLHWFKEIDISIIECYGMTENLTYSHGNLESPQFFGTVGKPYPDVEVKFNEDGEILIKSPCNLKGYYKDPERTLNELQGSFFKTGDIGQQDSQGHLTITGRKKDIFKTTKGLYVSPKSIEKLFYPSPIIQHICVIGDSLPSSMALITLDQEDPQFSKEETIKILLAQKEKVNEQLLEHERVTKIIILKDAWDENNGMLTPTLKVRRNFIEERFKKYYQKWHDLEEEVIWEEEA